MAVDSYNSHAESSSRVGHICHSTSSSSSYNKRNQPRARKAPKPPGFQALDEFPSLQKEQLDDGVNRPSYGGVVNQVRPRRPPLPSYIPPPNPTQDMTHLLNRVLPKLSELTKLIKPLIFTLTTVMKNLLPFLTKCTNKPWVFFCGFQRLEPPQRRTRRTLAWQTNWRCPQYRDKFH